MEKRAAVRADTVAENLCAGFTCGVKALRPDTILTRDWVEVADGDGVSRERSGQAARELVVRDRSPNGGEPHPSARVRSKFRQRPTSARLVTGCWAVRWCA